MAIIICSRCKGKCQRTSNAQMYCSGCAPVVAAEKYQAWLRGRPRKYATNCIRCHKKLPPFTRSNRRYCSKCKKIVKRESFDAIPKEVINASKRNYYYRNRGRINEYHRRWYAEHLETMRAKGRARYWRDRAKRKGAYARRRERLVQIAREFLRQTGGML